MIEKAMQPIPEIIFLTPSARWRSTLEFHLQQRLQSWKRLSAIDFTDCLKEVRQQRPQIAIVEIAANQVQETGRALSSRWEECGLTLFVAVGDQDLQPWLRYLRVSGFTDICLEISQVGPLSDRLVRHLQMSFGDEHPALESLIQNQLPWRPVAKTHVSGES